MSSSYTLRFLRYSPYKILKFKVTLARSNVNSRSHYNVAQINPLTIELTNYQLLHLTDSEIQTRQHMNGQGHYSKVKGQIKATLWHCTPTPPTNVPTKYKLPTPYSFSDTAQINYSCWWRSHSLGHHGWKQYPEALKGCGVKTNSEEITCMRICCKYY